MSAIPRQVESGAFGQRFASVEKNGSVLLIGEHVGKPLTEIVHQRRAAIEEHCAFALRGPRPAQPNGASAAGRFRQIGGLAPFQRFRQRTDALNVRLPFQRSVPAPRGAARERLQGTWRKLRRPQPAPEAAVSFLMASSRRKQAFDMAQNSIVDRNLVARLDLQRFQTRSSRHDLAGRQSDPERRQLVCDPGERDQGMTKHVAPTIPSALVSSAYLRDDAVRSRDQARAKSAALAGRARSGARRR